MPTWRKRDLDKAEPALRKRLGLDSVQKPKQKHKYGAHPTNGFPSKGEYQRFGELVLLEKQKIIKDLERYPTVYLTEANRPYKLDYYYREKVPGSKRKWRPVWEDYKGVITQRFRDLMGFWPHYGPGLLRVTKKDSSGRIRVIKEIYPK